MLKYATEEPELSGARFAELASLFEGELNPVNPKAQRKVPVPTGAHKLSVVRPPTTTTVISRSHRLPERTVLGSLVTGPWADIFSRRPRV